MKCPFCGKETAAKNFCSECGANISEYKPAEQEQAKDKITPNVQKLNRNLLVGGVIIAFFVLIVVIFFVSTNSKNTKDDDYSAAQETTYDIYDSYNNDYRKYSDIEATTKSKSYGYSGLYKDSEKYNFTEPLTDAPTEKHKIVNNTSTGDFWAKGSGDYVAKGLKVTNYGILHVSHSGNSNFVVKLYKDNSYEDLLVNTIGDYSGDVFVDGSGEYELEIKADGAWNITSNGLSIDDKTSFSGTGDSVTGITSHSGGNWKITNSGKSNFVVKQYGISSGYMDLLVNEIGSYNGVVKAESGDDIFFVVKSDGNWTIKKE